MSYFRTLVFELTHQFRALKTWNGLRRLLLETAIIWGAITVTAYLSWQSLAVLAIGLAITAVSWLTGQSTWQAATRGVTVGVGLAGILYLPYVIEHLID